MTGARVDWTRIGGAAMDMKELYALMERFEKSGLSELVFKKDGEEVALKKVLSAPQAPPAMPVAYASHETRAPSAEPHVKQASDTEIIRSPLVGTFYVAAAPDAPPFVEKGDTVRKGKPLCILEAMKLMNEFQAEFDLEIVAILAENGKMVEFGASLFEVRRV
ncbi:MAG TPA: acetyl-CoA carboxylase biotin carboxyl carrier protein [Spirochaetia bacterium]|nr:acetyl-CoA carboxylase biotin carboxyl carrier protein [Spirochaetia bacterium]